LQRTARGCTSVATLPAGAFAPVTCSPLLVVTGLHSMRALQQVLRALECNLVQQTPNGYQTVLQCSHMAYCTRVGVRGLHGQAPVYSSSCSSTSLVPSLQHTQPWHGWRTYKTAYERSTARSRQKIVDNGMYLVGVCQQRCQQPTWCYTNSSSATASSPACHTDLQPVRVFIELCAAVYLA